VHAHLVGLGHLEVGVDLERAQPESARAGGLSVAAVGGGDAVEGAGGLVAVDVRSAQVEGLLVAEASFFRLAVKRQGAPEGVQRTGPQRPVLAALGQSHCVANIVQRAAGVLLRQSSLTEADQEVGFVLLVATVTGEREGLLVVVDSVGVAAASLQYATDEVQRCGFGEAEPCLPGERESLPKAVQRLLVAAESKVVASEVEERQAHSWAVAGQLMGGAVLTETVFAWPGLGRLMVKAIFARDYVLLQGAVLVFALAFVLINLVVDLAYGALDPRVARQG